MKVGGNEPCPCGNGKKYKKCRLSKTYTDVGKEDSIRARLIEDLLRIFKENYQPRLEDAESIMTPVKNVTCYREKLLLRQGMAKSNSELVIL